MKIFLIIKIMSGESPKIATHDGISSGIGVNAPKSIVKNVFEHARLKFKEWARDGITKGLNNASVDGYTLARKLDSMLRENYYFSEIVKRDVGLLDRVCKAMYVVDMDDGDLLLVKLLQCAIEEDEEADKAAMMSNPCLEDPIGCFRAARWYTTNNMYPADEMSPSVWEYWARFNPPVTDPIPIKHQWHVAKGSSLDMLKRLIALPGWDLTESLSMACRKGMRKHVELFLEHGADVNAKDESGMRGLSWASKHGFKEIVEVLIKHGANVNARDDDTETALFGAGEWNHADIVELLIKHGADVNVTVYGMSVLEYVAQSFYSTKQTKNVVEVLRRYGAK